MCAVGVGVRSQREPHGFVSCPRPGEKVEIKIYSDLQGRQEDPDTGIVRGRRKKEKKKDAQTLYYGFHTKAFLCLHANGNVEGS